MIINTNNVPKKRLEEKETKKNTTKSKAIFLIVACILFLIVIILFQVYRNYTRNYNYLKKDKSEYLVYTRYNQNKKEVPYININSAEVENINKEIVDYCNQYVNIDNLRINYDYNINRNYLSVVIKVTDNSKEVPEVIFKTYNFNLGKRSVITNEDLKEYFQVNDEIISASIHNRFVEMYREEIREEYIVEELCDFDCYLKNRNVADYLSNTNLYIKDGKLIAFKPFNFASIYSEEDYFTEESFEFTITE